MQWKKLTIKAIILLTLLLSPFGLYVEHTQPINNNQYEVNSSIVSIELNQAYALSTGNCRDFALDPIECIGDGILWFYELLFYTTTQVIVVIVGLMTDAFIGFSISSSFYRQSGMIEAGWEILRDLTNIVFIFALLMMAFKLVLNQNDGKTKKTLVKVIGVAMVVNFSLFVSYAIIDSSNILAHVFYNKIDADVSDYSPDIKETETNNGTVTLVSSDGGVINMEQSLRALGIVKSPSIAIAAQVNPQRIVTLSGGNVGFLVGMILVTGMAIMNILLIYIFLSVSLLFLGRILGLIILTILSPLAFASLTIPELRKQKYFGWDSWFPEILKLSFMAPIYLFFLWLVVSFLSNEGVLATITKGGGGDWLNQILNTYLLLFLIGGLLYMAKKVTTDMAGDLGSMAAKTIGAAVGGTVAIAAVAATGGAAGVGLLSRGAGGTASALSKGKYGAGLSKFGKRMMSFKADVTKIPGFSKVAGTSATNMIGKVTNVSGRNIQTGAVLGGLKAGNKLSDMWKGRTAAEEDVEYRKSKEKIREDAKWQDRVNEEKASIELGKEEKKAGETKNTAAYAGGVSYEQHVADMEAAKAALTPAQLKSQKDETEVLEQILAETKAKSAKAVAKARKYKEPKAVIDKLISDAQANTAGARTSLEAHKNSTAEGQLERAKKDLADAVTKSFNTYANKIQTSGDNGGAKTAGKIRSGKIKPKKVSDDEK